MNNNHVLLRNEENERDFLNERRKTKKRKGWSIVKEIRSVCTSIYVCMFVFIFRPQQHKNTIKAGKKEVEKNDIPYRTCR